MAGRHGLAQDQVVIGREQLQDLHDRIYVVEAALEDVATDLAVGRPGAERYRSALTHLAEAAGGLAGYVLTPRSGPAGSPRLKGALQR